VLVVPAIQDVSPQSNMSFVDGIKGEVESLDKSFDIVMRIAYELLKDNLDAAIKKDGKNVH